MSKNFAENSPPSGWEELPPIPPAQGEFDPAPILGYPGCLGSEISAHHPDPDLDLSLEDAPGIRPGIETEPRAASEREVNMWRSRAARVQTTALNIALGASVIWMAKNVYVVRENFNPGSEASYFSERFHDLTSISVMICGAVMTCTSAAAAAYRSRAWTIEQTTANLE